MRLQLVSPEDFSSRNLALLWAALQELAELGWDYAVQEVEPRSLLVIHLEARSHRVQPLNGFASILRACERSRPTDLSVMVYAHHGAATPSNLECMYTIRQI